MRIAVALVLATGCVGPAVFVETSGDGDGVVRSDPRGIECGDACGALLDGPITLTAIPDEGSLFDGWAGACSGIEDTCSLDVTDDVSVRARFRRKLHDVSVVVNKGGMVESSPAGISCGDDCSESIPHGTRLQLTPVPAPGYRFVAWDAAECGERATCTVDIVEPRTFVATFQPDQLLTTAMTGTGYGYIQSSPAGITAGTDAATYPYGTVVTLEAMPDPISSRFDHWEGDCQGSSPTCVLTLTQTSHAIAVFGKKTFVTVELQGSGSGTVTSSPTGISCPGQCVAGLPSGEVTLHATPAPGSTFGGWSGAGCVGTSDTCTFPATSATSVVAMFDQVYTAPCTSTVTANENATAFNARLKTQNAVVCLAAGVTIDGAVVMGAFGVTIRGGVIQNLSGTALSLGGYNSARLEGVVLEARGNGVATVDTSSGSVNIFDSVLRCEGAGSICMRAPTGGLLSLHHSTVHAGVATQSSSYAAVASGGEVQIFGSDITSFGPLLSVSSSGRLSVASSLLESLDLSSGSAAIAIAGPSLTSNLYRNVITVGGYDLLHVAGTVALAPTLYLAGNQLRKRAGTAAGDVSPITSDAAATTLVLEAGNTICNEGTSTTDGAFALPLVSGSYNAAGSSIATLLIGTCPP